MALVAQAQQRHQMDQEFAAAATGNATPALPTNSNVHESTGNIN